MTSTTQKTIIMKRCGPRPDFASLTLAFDLQLRKNTEKPVRVVKECCYPPYPHSHYYVSLTHPYSTKPSLSLTSVTDGDKSLAFYHVGPRSNTAQSVQDLR